MNDPEPDGPADRSSDAADRTSDSGRGSTIRIVLLIGVLSLILIFYFVLLGQRGIDLIRVGSPASIGLGVGVLLLPIVGVWILWSTLAAGLTHQRLARLIDEQGMELDVSDLPRRPSGRIDRAAADELFAEVRAEVEAHPDDWRRYYRLARAYDYAGDRSRARSTMRRAADLERAGRATH